MTIPLAIPGYTLDWQTNFSPHDATHWSDLFGVWGPANAGGGQADDYEPGQVHVPGDGTCSIVCRQEANGSRVSGGIGSFKAKPLTAGLWVCRARIISQGSIDSVLLGWPATSHGAQPWPVGQEWDFVEANPAYSGTSFTTTLHHGADNQQNQTSASKLFDVNQFHTYYMVVEPGKRLSVGTENLIGPRVTVVQDAAVGGGAHFFVAENLAQGRCTVGVMTLTHVSQWSVIA